MNQREELKKYHEIFENELFNILDYWTKFGVVKGGNGFYGAVDSVVKVNFFKPVKESWLTNIIEEDPIRTEKDDAFKVCKYAIESFKLKS